MEGYKVALAWLPCLALMLIGSAFRAMVHPREMVEHVLIHIYMDVGSDDENDSIRDD